MGLYDKPSEFFGLAGFEITEIQFLFWMAARRFVQRIRSGERDPRDLERQIEIRTEQRVRASSQLDSGQPVTDWVTLFYKFPYLQSDILPQSSSDGS